MAGTKEKSGRRKKLGRVYYLGRYRFIPGLDPLALEVVLQAITTAGDEQRRRDIIRRRCCPGRAKRNKQPARWSRP